MPATIAHALRWSFLNAIVVTVEVSHSGTAYARELPHREHVGELALGEGTLRLEELLQSAVVAQAVFFMETNAG